MDLMNLHNTLDKLYAEAYLGEAGNRLSQTDPNVFSASVRESIIDGIYNGTFTPENPDPRLIDETARFLEKRLQIGYGRGFIDQLEEVDRKTLASLRNNLREFAEAKARVQTRELREQMFNNLGKRAREAVKTDTTRVFNKYNENYLKAEGNVTEKQSRVARDWRNFERKGAKFLRYTAVLDDRTRPEHRQLDGTVRSMNDSFWDNHTPPLGYNCRCKVERVNSPKVGRPKENLPEPENDLFSRNPARTKKIFPKTLHPYFK